MGFIVKNKCYFFGGHKFKTSRDRVAHWLVVTKHNKARKIGHPNIEAER